MSMIGPLAARPVVNPGNVLWGGDHLLLYLRRPGSDEDVTLVSYYRTLFSPAGAGRTAMVLSDLNGDGWGPDDHRAIYTDNPAMTAWARQNLARAPGHPFRDPSLPVVTARFEDTGAVGSHFETHIVAPGAEIALTWQDFEAPIAYEGVQGTLAPDYDIFSVLGPAARASVTINGRAAPGQPYPREVWRKTTGRALSSALIAICEFMVWRG